MKCIILDEKVFSLKDGILSYHFKIRNGKNKKYKLNLKFLNDDLIYSNCTCIFGSFFKYTKKNLALNRECYHIKELINYVQNKGGKK